MRVIYFSVIITAFLLTSCEQNTLLPQQYQKISGNAVSAEDIDPDLGGKCLSDISGHYNCTKNLYPPANNAEDNKAVYDKKTYIALLVGDSQKKCDDFTRHLSGLESSRSGMSNVAGAIGALPQMQAINAVANASGVAGNFTGNSESDEYARKNINNYVQAIRFNYGVQIKRYINDIEVKDENKINVAIEINNIRIIHGQCSLTAAQSYISERLNDKFAPASVPSPAVALPNDQSVK